MKHCIVCKFSAYIKTCFGL